MWGPTEIPNTELAINLTNKMILLIYINSEADL